jgi:formylglycine-generating enzyme required for sulfatase activity
MIGNAWQWCEDRYGDYEEGTATAPTGPNTGGIRVVRGRSWKLYPGFCRSAFRGRSDPDGRTDRRSFRVAVSSSAN